VPGLPRARWGPLRCTGGPPPCALSGVRPCPTPPFVGAGRTPKTMGQPVGQTGRFGATNPWSSVVIRCHPQSDCPIFGGAPSEPDPFPQLGAAGSSPAAGIPPRSIFRRPRWSSWAPLILEAFRESSHGRSVLPCRHVERGLFLRPCPRPTRKSYTFPAHRGPPH
jgi:hypothetical protein